MKDDAPSSPPPASGPGTGIIPVRSRQQAMDWSLVLMSQGIETIIEKPGESGNWTLLVSDRDYSNALRILRQYRIENRGWPWQSALPLSGTDFDWRSVGWAVVLVGFYWNAAIKSDFRTAGVMDSSAVASGQWWRIFTAMFLHADLGHLAENLSFGILLLGLAMKRYGSALGLLAAYLAGAGGNVVSLFFNEKPFHGLGASGMVMGALGLLAAQSLTLLKGEHRPLRPVLVGVAAGIMLFVLLGLSPGSDLAAHFGGFVSGLIIGAILALLAPKIINVPATEIIAWLALAVMVVIPWWLALSRIRAL